MMKKYSLVNIRYLKIDEGAGADDLEYLSGSREPNLLLIVYSLTDRPAVGQIFDLME